MGKMETSLYAIEPQPAGIWCYILIIHHQKLPVRVGDRKDEEVEHVEEVAVARVGDQLVHHEGDSGGADPLPCVNTCDIILFRHSFIYFHRHVRPLHPCPFCILLKTV